MKTGRQENEQMGKWESGKGAPQFLAGDSWPTASPLTPALSPLRGVGVAMHLGLQWVSVRPRTVRLRHRAHTAAKRGECFRHGLNVRRAPSPLNGEGARVRGENTIDGPLQKTGMRPSGKAGRPDLHRQIQPFFVPFSRLSHFSHDLARRARPIRKGTTAAWRLIRRPALAHRARAVRSGNGTG